MKNSLPLAGPRQAYCEPYREYNRLGVTGDKTVKRADMILHHRAALRFTLIWAARQSAGAGSVRMALSERRAPERPMVEGGA